MTVKQDLERRISEAAERESTGDFGARIMRFCLIGAMERMDEVLLNKELDIEES